MTVLNRLVASNRTRLTRMVKDKRLVCYFLTGVCLGYIVGPLIDYSNCGQGPKLQVRSAGPLKSLIDFASGGTSKSKLNDFVIINIITAEMFLETRATNVHRTWAPHIPGKVLFMAKGDKGNSTFNNSLSMPVVRLKSVDDTYPPQKKSFLSMRYAYDNYINDYEWFMRADDDVYIKGEQLNAFLRDLNSSEPLYIGVPGRGKEDELGILGLKAEDNYCMGGPGMIFSRETIRRVAPNLHMCLKDLYSDHEDVEIGRCIRRFARINCTWNYENAEFFYQNYADYNGAYRNKGALESVHKAITLHPIKLPPHMYRIHNYWLGIRIYDKRERNTALTHDMTMCQKMISGVDPDPPLPRNRDNVAQWTYIDKKRIYDPLTLHPAKGLHLHAFHDAYNIMKDTIFNMENINRTNDNEMNKKFYNMEQGYMRVNGKYAAEYFLQFLVESKYAKNKKFAATRPIDYRVWVRQPFQEPEIRLSDYPDMGASVEPQIQQAMTDPTSPIVLTKTIHFMLALSGRIATYLRFMGMLDDIAFKDNEDISLTIVQYPHPENDSCAEVIQTMNAFGTKYPHYKDRLKVITLNATFSRGGGLTTASDSLSRNDSLMFFIDVDIMLTKDVLGRIRANTIQYRQPYYPIVFSQFDPDAACQPSTICPKDWSVTSRYNGYWRAFGMGIVGMYKSDLNIAGGFDRSIVGWGKEDVDLYEKFIKSNLTVFRTTDRGQVHVFHKIICDPNLEPAQYRMCFNTKAASYASTYTLSEKVLNTPVLMEFDVSSFNFSKMAKGKPAPPPPTTTKAKPAAAAAPTTAKPAAAAAPTTAKPTASAAAATTAKPAAAPAPTTAKPAAAPAPTTAKPAAAAPANATAAATTAKPLAAAATAAPTTAKPAAPVDPKKEAAIAAAAVPAAVPVGAATPAAAAPAAAAPAAAAPAAAAPAAAAPPA